MTQSPLDNKTFQWLVASVITVLLAVSGLIYSNLDMRIRVLESFGSPNLRERIAKVESDRDIIYRDLAEIKQTQKEIMTLLRLHMESNANSRMPK